MNAQERRRLLRPPTVEGVWVAIAIVVPVVVAFLTPNPALDLAYQIRAGNVMLDTHHLLALDTFTYTVNGQPWLNQQWGAQVLLASLYRVGGWGTIMLARGALIAATLLFIYRACREEGAAPRTSAFLTLAGWVVAIEILPVARPQQFGFVLFATCLWAITVRHRLPWLLWLMPVLVIPWANVHGSFPLVFVLLGLAWLRDRRADPRLARRILAVAGLSAFATLVNPYGVRVWAYVNDLSTNPVVSQRVSEWRTPSVHSLPGLLFFLSLFAVAALLARRREQIGWLTLLTLGVFAGLSLLAIRGVVWWALVAPVVVAGILADGSRARAPQRSPMNAVMAVGLAVLVAVTLPFGRGTNPATGGPAVLTFAPERLIAAVRDTVPPGSHIFVSQFPASWSEFSAPTLPVAVDSRVELFPESVWDDYFTVSAGRQGWQDVLDRWGVDALILDPDQAEGLLMAIGSDPLWRLLLHTDEGSAYVRT